MGGKEGDWQSLALSAMRDAESIAYDLLHRDGLFLNEDRVDDLELVGNRSNDFLSELLVIEGVHPAGE